MAIAPVQIAPTGYTHSGPAVACTLGALPTIGNALAAMVYDTDNGSVPNRAVADWTGWSSIAGGVGGDLMSYQAIAWRPVRQADRDALGVITVPATLAHGWNDVYLMVREYSGFGGDPALDVGNAGSLQGPASSAVIPIITPAAGKNRLLLANSSLNPNYGPAAPGTWTKVQEEAVLGNRQTMQWLEKLVASTAGSYGGDTIGPAGVGAETEWWIPIVALGGSALEPRVPGMVSGGPFG